LLLGPGFNPASESDFSAQQLASGPVEKLSDGRPWVTVGGPESRRRRPRVFSATRSPSAPATPPIWGPAVTSPVLGGAGGLPPGRRRTVTPAVAT
jgi:hypothetical protein